jgi:hypothetical protein
MSFKSGMHRLAHVMRWVGAGILSVILLLLVVGALGSGWGALGYAIMGGIFSSMYWAVAWVIEGFAKD